MQITFRNVARLACMGMMVIAQVGAWAAQDEAANYPRKPVRLIVPFAPGGSSDFVGRLIGQKLSEMWGQQFVLDNRPGAGGAIGAELVARATPDGYTILVTNQGPGLFNVVLRRKPPYTFDDFASIIYVGYAVNTIIANPKFPPNNAKELIAYAKAHPGKINWSSAGLNSNPHVALEMFKAATGIDVLHVPYKGQGPALTDLVAGQVDVTYASLLSAENYFKSGRVKILGVSGPSRQAVIPNIPTFTEQGVPAADSILWFGLQTTAGTPRAVIKKLNAGVNKALQMPDVRKRFEQLGVLIEGGAPEKFDAVIRSDAKRMAPLIKSGALRVE